ncbi:MAG: c-type cytochrome [Steroidobacter sp.]
MLLSIACLSLWACGQESVLPATDVDVEQRARELEPADPHLAELYRQSCRACHTVAGSGAPLTGHRAAWDERWRKGLDALRSNTIRGLNGMPAGGQCFACSAQDYDGLIEFMAGRTRSNTAGS